MKTDVSRRSEPAPPKEYPAARALAELEAQHDALRGMMGRCEELADELDAGRADPLHLAREVARLRLAFEAHNRFEEQLLRPVLRGTDAFAEVRIDRMIEDHVGEHRAMRTQLNATETSALRETIDLLRAYCRASRSLRLARRPRWIQLPGAPRGGAE